MHTFKVLSAYFKQNLKEAFAYRVDSLVNVLTMLLWQAWEIGALLIIFSNTQSIGGWRIGDMIALMGVFRLVNMFMATIVWPNTEQFNRGIREGTLDYTFLQPLDSQFAVSFQKMVVWRVFDALIATVLIIVGLFFAGSAPSLGATLLFLALMVTGATIIYSLWIMLIALTFWFTKFDNNVTLMQALMDSGRYPSTVYPAWLRIIVTFVVPIAVATTVPLQALRGELEPWQIAAAFAACIAAFAASRFVWSRGVRRYSGASS